MLILFSSETQCQDGYKIRVIILSICPCEFRHFGVVMATALTPGTTPAASASVFKYSKCKLIVLESRVTSRFLEA